MARFELAVPARVAVLALVALVLPPGLALGQVSAQGSNGLSLREGKQLLNKLEDGQVALVDKQCGISCLYLVLKLHGFEPKFAELQELIPVGKHGASLHDLADVSRKLGFQARAVRCKPDELDSLRLPAIAHLEVFNDPYPYLHYVVITKIDGSDMTMFDPFDNRTRTVNRSDMGGSLSGHFLVAADREANVVGAVLAIVGLLVSGLGAWRVFGAWRSRSARRRAVGGGLARGATACVVAVCCSFGCGRTATAPSPPNSAATVTARAPLESQNTSLDLGSLQWNTEVKGEFRFRNVSASPIQLRLGPASCSCLKVEMGAAEVLQPGAEGRLHLYLDTMHRDRAGKVEGCVPLFAGGGEEPLQFCVKGFLDGAIFPQPSYVIRLAHQRAGKIPPFHFDVLSRTKKDLTITGITFASLAEIKNVQLKGGARTDTKTLNAKTLSQVTADLATMTVSPQHYQASDEVYVRSVDVPLRVDGALKTLSGKIIVDYILGGEELQAHTNLLILGADAN